MRSPRAIVFDLDDTLYPRRAFVRSGFAAAAAVLSARTSVPAHSIYRLLCRATRAHEGRELQRVCARLGVPEHDVPALVDVIRAHRPRLSLARQVVSALERLRRDWRIGILTNGVPAIQRRKIDALGLAPLVDAVVCAADCGRGAGKPDPAAFRAVLARLGAEPRLTVFVGDDPIADIAGARRAGLQTIQVPGPSWRRLPRLAARLIEERAA